MRFLQRIGWRERHLVVSVYLIQLVWAGFVEGIEYGSDLFDSL
jgi:hypothetical protein